MNSPSNHNSYLSSTLRFFSLLRFKPGRAVKQGVDLRICEELRERMNRCAYQQNNNALASLGDFGMMASSVSDGVVCPKPRRVGLLIPSSYQAEFCDSRAGAELLDMILTKGNYGSEKPNHHVPSSPPYFMGSPPSRASNPVIQDAHFGMDKPSLLSLSPEASPSSQLKNGGSARVKYGQKPAAVRIEGFNCRGNCSISAVA